MKFSTFLLLTISIFTATTRLSAQIDRYVEITVADTVVLKALDFTYEIRSGSSPYSFGMKEENDKNAIPLHDIESLLTKNKFDFKVEENPSYLITPESQPNPVITVPLNSESEIKRLYDILRKLQGISGRISDANFEPLSDYKNEIFSNLYARAVHDANDLAKISGNSIGQLISVREPQSDYFSGMMDWYKEVVNKNDAFQMFGLHNGMTPKN